MRALVWAVVVTVVGLPSHAFIPDPETIARAAAKENREAKRAEVLQLDITARRLTADAAQATGTLLASPDSRARLILRHEKGFEERQLRRSGGISAARDGRLLDRPHPLLPPYWVLQARSGNRLLSQLAELGGDPGRIAMGYDGVHDCYVLGGKTAVSFWVDQDDLSIARIDVAGGVTYRVGPALGPEKGLRVPSWIEIEAPGLPAMRIEVLRARVIEAPAGAFHPDWLQASGE